MSEEDIKNLGMDMIIVIDKDKLPEELRDKLPQDLQKKLIELLQTEQSNKKEQSSKTELSNKNIKNTNPSGLFAIQQGRVVGNIYKDSILPE